jgi:hypothetical protein
MGIADIGTDIINIGTDIADISIDIINIINITDIIDWIFINSYKVSISNNNI